MKDKKILLRRSTSLSTWIAKPPVLFTLLILSFGAGMLIMGLLLRPAPETFPPQVPSPVPRTPTPIPPTPTFVPTPTPTSLEESDAASADIVASLFRHQPLETLYINIAPDDFAQIEAKRQEALEHWILLTSGADFVDATLHVGRGPVIPVELRLKGDWGDHYVGDKWSFRVETQGDHHLWGMAVFSLQDPGTRAYLNEWLFMAHLRAEDVLSVRYRFVHVVQNGAYKGIYALEEGFSKELFESLQRREGVIIRYDEDLVWAYRVAYANDELVPRGVNEFHLIDEFDSNRINTDPTLSAQRDAAVGKLRALWTGEQPASEVFDIETMGKFLALTDLWGARHALIWHNVRFYYNPVTTRLEPIGFDTQPLAGGATITLDSLDGLRQSLAYGEKKGAPSPLQRAYAAYLWQFSQPAYLAWLQDRFGVEFMALREALRPEFGPAEDDTETPYVLEAPWNVLAQRQAALRELLSPYQTVYAYVLSPMPDQSTSRHPPLHIPLEIGNLLDLPVEIVGLLHSRNPHEMIPIRPEWLAADASEEASGEVAISPPDSPNVILPALASDATSIPYTRLHIPLQTLGIEPGAATTPLTPSSAIASLPDLQIVTRMWGLTRTITQTVIPRYPPPLVQGPLPPRPTLEEALDQHPYLQLYSGVSVGDLTQHEQDRNQHEQILHIASGTHIISGNLVLPEGYGLYLGPGTTLRFDVDNFLFADGPLIFEGTETMPIVLQPSGERWLGVVVMEAEAPSAWEYVTVERTSAIDQDGWILTGGITFYRSPIRLDHCRIVKTEAEDAINVIRAPFEFVESEFAETASDAFDADFSQGRVEQCSFHDIAADGIDVSGAEVQVYDVYMQNIGDKGLSVGEQSYVTARHVILEDVNFGVVSKDLSQVTASALTIRRARLAGLAAYIKKTAYGPASITATNVTFVNIPQERRTLVQTESWIDLDGTRIWGTDINVEALYAP